VNSESNYIQTTLKNVRRDAGEVSYQLTASLRPDAPVGKWYTDVWLKTNNPATPRIRVPLTVEIESALSVSPATVSLGQARPVPRWSARSSSAASRRFALPRWWAPTSS